MNADEFEGKSLPYVLMTPDTFDGGGGWPLVVLLHGFGASMYDLAGLASEIDDRGYVYAFPNAPLAVPIGYGRYGYSWQARDRLVEAPPDLPPLDEQLDAFLDEVKQQTGTVDGRIVLGGFSQGGGVTLRYGLPRPHIFAGLAVLSGAVRDADGMRQQLPADRSQPVFIGHGRTDPQIPIERGRATKAFLEVEGYAPVYREYEMGHQITPQEIADLRPWLHKVLLPKVV